MKILAITTTLMLCAASLTAFADSIDGKWISEREVGAADGKTYTHTTTLTLKSEGGLLTGTVVQVSAAPWIAETNGRSIEIKRSEEHTSELQSRLHLVCRLLL